MKLATLSFLFILTAYSQELERPESIITIKPSGASSGSLYPDQGKIALVSTNWIYTETDTSDGSRFMRDSGPLYGLKASYELMTNGSAITWDISYSFLTGKTVYDGGYQNGEKFKDSSKNSISELSTHIGIPFFVNQNQILLRPYLGLSSRNLKNPASGKAGSYSREAKYLTLPIGMNLRFAINSKSHLGFDAHYNELISAQTDTDFGDIDPSLPLLSFKQKSGKGYGFSASYVHILTNLTLSISPYFQRWDFENSEPDYITYFDSGLGKTVTAGFLEPKNVTNMYGINLSVGFN